jgi:F-type H+-transporting ATPase subunit epsilon
VTGGFAEISASGVSVLAERAVPLDEVTPAAGPADRRRLRGDRGCLDKDAADKAMADLLALRAAAGH